MLHFVSVVAICQTEGSHHIINKCHAADSVVNTWKIEHFSGFGCFPSILAESVRAKFL